MLIEPFDVHELREVVDALANIGWQRFLSLRRDPIFLSEQWLDAVRVAAGTRWKRGSKIKAGKAK